MRIDRADILPLIALGLIGQFGYQVFSVLALQRTTGTNVSLMLATVPTWTAVLSIVLGAVLIRRAMLLGLGLSLSGVALVIVSATPGIVRRRARRPHRIVLALAAALVASIFAINIKRSWTAMGASVIATWTYTITCVSLWPSLAGPPHSVSRRRAGSIGRTSSIPACCPARSARCSKATPSGTSARPA